MDFFELASAVFKYDEGDGLPGLEGRPYKDTKGLWTIGRGHLIGASLTDLRLPPGAIEALFREDLNRSIKDAKEIFGESFYNLLYPARKIAILSLLFTLGKTKFLTFNDTIAAIKQEKWEEAARLILLTKWAKDVDPRMRTGQGRDDRVAYMLRYGAFPPEYPI